eukprot:15431573-Alexandrium_andersonii.AAC.1
MVSKDWSASRSPATDGHGVCQAGSAGSIVALGPLLHSRGRAFARGAGRLDCSGGHQPSGCQGLANCDLL